MMIKCLGMFGNFLKLVVCEAFKGPLRATKLFYTGARRHPQNLCFISILKSEIHVFMSIDMVCRLKKKLTHIHIHAGGIQLQGPTRTHTHTHIHIHAGGIQPQGYQHLCLCLPGPQHQGMLCTLAGVIQGCSGV